MDQEETIKELEKSLCDFEYVGEVIATIHYHELASVREVVSYYYKLWELTENLTDEYLQRKENQIVDIHPGGYGQVSVEGMKVPFNVDAVIESFRNQEKYIESILLALRKHYSRHFPKNDKFGQTLRPTP